MCYEIYGHVGLVRVPVAPHGTHIVAEELLEGPCTEAALEPGAVWGEDMIRLCITRKTENQMSRRVEELTVLGVYRYPHRSVIPDFVEDPVRGNLMISVAYVEPETVEVERFCIVLVGQAPQC